MKHVRKYHIGKSGPAPCDAQTGKCPYGGGTEHFRTHEDAAEFEYGSKVQLTKINGTIGRIKPHFDIRKASFNVFTIDKAATLETKNRGEYSELYALQHFLSEEESHFSENSKTFEVTAVQAKNHQYLIEQNGDQKNIFFKTPNGIVSKCDLAKHEQTQELLKILVEGSQKTGVNTFSSKMIQDECVRLGFSNGRVPKAPSHSKTDLRVWDENGCERRLSVKSYLGRNPGLMSASTASVVSYPAHAPKNISPSDCHALAEKASKAKSYSQAYKILKNAGVRFDSSVGVPDHPKFRKNLECIDPNAQKAYSKALFQMVDKDTSIQDDPKLVKAYHKTLGNFAHGMTYTRNPPKSEQVTDFLTVKSDGSVMIQNFPNVEETGSNLASRVEFMAPAKARSFGGGTVEYIDGKFIFKLNSNVEIYETVEKRTKKIRNTNRGKLK